MKKTFLPRRPPNGGIRAKLHFAAVAVTVAASAAATWAAPTLLPIDKPIRPKGTVSFKLHVDQSFENGADAERTSVTVISIPKFADVRLQQTATSVSLFWQWREAKGAPFFRPQFRELPGPDTYHLLFTWDAEQGHFDYYINGCPARVPGVKSEPWQSAESATEIVGGDAQLKVTDLQVQPRYLPPQAARDAVPEEYRGRRGKLFGAGLDVEALSIEQRRGRLLYETALGEENDVKSWVLEGPGKVTFQDGWMQMRSTRPDATGDVNGHIVFWCPQDFPESFVAEWEIQIVSDLGLTIVFFAAKGENGEDIFDPSLPPRDGTFAHYIRGAVKSYHISYYASTPFYRGRPTSNLRKNNRFYLLASGPVAIPVGSKDVHKVRLIKDRGHIQLQLNGKVSIDCTDDGGDRYGPVYGGGKIGMRQMQWTVGRYRNLRVWQLRPGVD
jgi:hypothetical protein